MEDQVISYLKSNPDFFEKNAQLLTELYLPSPHGRGAISLAERQQIAQRDKIRVLESRFTELILNAEENNQTSEKIHRLTLGLLSAQNFEMLNQHIVTSLNQDFQLPDGQLRIWSHSPMLAEKFSAFVVVDDAVRNWAKDLTHPYCGGMPSIEINPWFSSTPASIAIVPLRNEQMTFGMLLLPSDNNRRFYPGMGTLFLSRIGELISASLLRYLG